MDWSAFAPDRPPGSSPAPQPGLTSPTSPTWLPGAAAAAGAIPPSSSHFSPGQLVSGLAQVHLGTGTARGPPSPTGGTSSSTSPAGMYPYAPYSHQPPSLPSPHRAAPIAGYAASSRPRPPQLAPITTSVPGGTHQGASPIRPSPPGVSVGVAVGVSPLRTSSRKASLPAATTPTSSALPPLPSLPPSGPFPTSASHSSLNGEGGASSQTSHASSAPPNRSSPVRTATAPATTSKRANPLEDLIATETVYVQDLGVIIKRVAAAWSRTNFPPPQLDGMFRAIEAVYRINKALLAVSFRSLPLCER